MYIDTVIEIVYAFASKWFVKQVLEDQRLFYLGTCTFRESLQHEVPSRKHRLTTDLLKPSSKIWSSNQPQGLNR